MEREAFEFVKGSECTLFARLRIYVIEERNMGFNALEKQ